LFGWTYVLPIHEELPLQSAVADRTDASNTAGREAGDAYSKGFQDRAVVGAEKASAAVEAARRKQEDAAGRVSVAQARLIELQNQENVSTSRLAAGVEAYSRAQRAHQAAQEGVERATRSNARAQDALRTSNEGSGFSFRQLAQSMTELNAKSEGLDRTSKNLTAAIRTVGTVGALAFGSLAGQAGVGALVAVGGAAAVAAGSLLLLPAAGVAVAAPLATVQLGLVGVNDAFKALNDGKMDKFEEALAKMAPSAAATFREVAAMKPAFDDLRQSIQQNMFEGLAQYVRPLGEQYFPMLRHELGLFADIINGAATEVAQFLVQGRTVGDIAMILGNVRSAFGELEQAAQPIVQILIDIAAVGSTFMPGLSAGFGDLAQKTADWVARARETGILADIMSQGLSVVGQLGMILGNLAIILFQVFRIGSESGGGFLNTLVQVTTGVREFVTSAEGMQVLRDAFSAVGAAVGAVLPLVQVAASIVLGTLVPAFAQFALILAPIAHELLLSLRTSFSQLAPMVPALAGAVGSLAGSFIPLIPLVTQLALILLPPLLSIITALGPIFPYVAIGIFAAVQAFQALNAIVTFSKLALDLWESRLIVIKVATGLWTAAQWLLNAALNANPIGLIVLGLAALGAALYLAWTHSETFRAIVTAAWDGVRAGWDFLWQAIQTGWGYIKAALDAIGAAGIWLYQNALLPAFNGILAAWNALSAGLQWAWANIIQPLWNAVSIAAQYLLAVLAVMVFAPILIAWNLMSAGFRLAYDNIILPLWNALQFAMQGLRIFLEGVWVGLQVAWRALSDYWQYIYLTVIQPLWNTLQTVMNGVAIFVRGVWTGMQIAWQAMGDFFVWVYNSIILPLWNALMAYLEYLWNARVRPTLDLIMRGWRALGDFFVWVYNTIILPLWNALMAYFEYLWNARLRPTMDLIMRGFRALGDFFRWVYDNIIQPAWDAVARSLTWLKDRFQDAVNWIRDIWNGIKRVLAVPINFMIRTVWNGGIVPAWNMVADLLPGVGKLKPAAPIAEAATGGQFTRDGVNNYAGGGQLAGRYRGPTADNLLGIVDNKVPIKVNPFEWIHPVKAVQKYGARFMQQVQKGTFPTDLARAGTQTPARYRPSDNVRRADVREHYANGGLVGFAQGSIVDMGRILQGMGAKVTEHPAFGGVAMGGHGKTSLHYTGHAIDVNTRPGTSALEQRELAPMAALARSKGFRTIFMAPDHYNHLHVDDGGGGPIGAIGDFIADLAADLKKKVIDLFANPARAFVNKIGDRPPPAFNDIPRKMGNFLIDKAVEMFNGKADEQGAAQGYSPIGTGTGPVVDQVRSAATLRGWGAGGQWNALDWVISHESGWNPGAQNPVSSASGLFQFIDGTWRAYRPPQAAGFAKMRLAPPNLQAAAGMSYIGARYKDPVGAKAFWAKNHWYGEGGQIPAYARGGHTRNWRQEGMALLHPDERVLAPEQDTYFRRFVDAVETKGAAGGRRQVAETINVYANDRDQGQDVVDRLWHKVRVADRGGVYTFTA
jgi:phage-related protein